VSRPPSYIPSCHVPSLQLQPQLSSSHLPGHSVDITHFVHAAGRVELLIDEPTMARSSLIVLLTVSLLCTRVFAVAECYYPDGTQAVDDMPCDSEAEESACCGGGFGSVCLSNKLCQSPDEGLIRGSCTSENWSSPECAQYCLGRSLPLLSAWTDLCVCVCWIDC
jgi:hypothetical protein